MSGQQVMVALDMEKNMLTQEMFRRKSSLDSVIDKCGRRWEKWVSRMTTRVVSFTKTRNLEGKWAAYNTFFRNFPETWFLPTEPLRRIGQQAAGLRFIPQQKKI